MPFVFLVVGIGLLVTAIRGTQGTAYGLLENEFSGPNSFLKWALALMILGAAGYIKAIQPITRGLMVLVLLVIVLKNKGGLFASFNSQVANPVPASATGAGLTSGAAISGVTPPGGSMGNTAPIAPVDPTLSGLIPGL